VSRVQDTGKVDNAELREQLRDLEDQAVEPLVSIANLSLLSGVAGTMVALFKVASHLGAQLQGASATISRTLLVHAFSESFGAFAVTIAGVSLGAAAFLLAHRMRTSIQRAAYELQLELEGYVGDQISSGQVTGDFERAIHELEVGLEGALEPLTRLDELVGALQASSQRMGEFVQHGTGIQTAMQALSASADSLKATAASLPQAYRDHTATALGELQGFGNDSERAFKTINDQIAQIAHHVGNIPDQVSGLLQRSLEEYNLKGLQVFQTHIQAVERMGSVAETSMPQVQNALAGLQPQLASTSRAIAEMAEQLKASARQFETAMQKAQTSVAAESRPSASATMTGFARAPWAAVAVIVVVMVGAQFVGPLVDAWQVPKVDDDLALRSTIAGQSATFAAGRHEVVVPVGARVSESAGDLVAAAHDYAIVRAMSRQPQVVWLDGADPALKAATPAVLAALAVLDSPRAGTRDRIGAMTSLAGQMTQCRGAVGPALTEAMAALAADPNEAIAIEALGQLGVAARNGCEMAAAIKEWRRALRDGSPRLRTAAARAAFGSLCSDDTTWTELADEIVALPPGADVIANWTRASASCGRAAAIDRAVSSVCARSSGTLPSWCGQPRASEPAPVPVAAVDHGSAMTTGKSAVTPLSASSPVPAAIGSH